MLNCLDWADFILAVCTETYHRRFRGHEEPGKGKGYQLTKRKLTHVSRTRSSLIGAELCALFVVNVYYYLTPSRQEIL
jgi:hypothetical protein